MLEVFGVELGSVFQGLITVFTGGAFLTFLINMRKLNQTGNKINLDAEAVLRNHFAKQLMDLEERYRQSDERHEECLKDRDNLRKRVRELEDHLEGVYRMLVQTSAEKVIELGELFPPHIVKLARRTVGYSRVKEKH